MKGLQLSQSASAARAAFVIAIGFFGLLLTAEWNPLQAQSRGEYVPITDAMILDPDPDDWIMWRRTLDGWGYSPLKQIDRDNVGELRLVWTRAMGAGSQQATPLVYDGVMFLPNPSDLTQAIDAETGDLLWEHRQDVPDDIAKWVGGLETTNRSLALYGNYVFDTSADDYIYALDATTGRTAWETQIFDHTVHPARQSSGPFIANGKLISGRSCRPLAGPVSCVITAHDPTTGEHLWSTRLIPAPGEPGDETWGDVPYEERVHVGAWMVPSYDPALDLIYMGTSVTSPAPKFMLGGTRNKHLYHNSTLAISGESGEIAWYYQHLIDHWDLDHPYERILVDTAVAPDPAAVSWINPRLQAGERRRVVTGIPGKTGVVYTIDRETGEFLWANPTISQNVINNIDGATGEVTENGEVVFTAVGQAVTACPSLSGGKNWDAGAYSPDTHLMYFSLRNTCAEQMATDQGTLYELASRRMIAPGTENLGTVRAISVETGETVWLHEQRAASAALIATGGGLVFGGDYNGRFRAFDQETGEVLWEINLGSPHTGYPITYAVDGRQYVVASTGSAANASSMMRLTPELVPSAGNNIFVFALPD